MFLRFLGVVALAATGCTLDYDALADGAGGDGPGPSSTSTGEATTSTTATSTSTATTTTTTTGGSTSTASGEGGAGQGGEGGAGGQPGAGGQGGAGGELPFSAPCEGLAITFTDDLDDSLGDAWDDVVLDGDPTITTDARDGLLVGLAGEVDDAEAGGIRTVDDALSGCSITVDVTALDPADPEAGFIGAGILVGDLGLGVDVVVEPGDGGTQCVVRSGALFEEPTSIACSGEAPERTLRVRHTGTELCFDVGPLGGPLVPLGPCLPVEGPQPVFVGAAAESEASVTFGAID